MNIIENLKDLIGDMPAWLKAIVIIFAICGVLGYAYITNQNNSEKSGPEGSVNKEIKLDTIKAETKNGDAATGQINIAQ